MEAGLKIRQHIICEELGPRQGFAVTIQFEFLVGADETLGRTATAAQDATVNAGGRLCSATTTQNGHLGGCPLPSGLRARARYLGVERGL